MAKGHSQTQEVKPTLVSSTLPSSASMLLMLAAAAVHDWRSSLTDLKTVFENDPPEKPIQIGQAERTVISGPKEFMYGLPK